jgi:hypothetical protein
MASVASPASSGLQADSIPEQSRPGERALEAARARKRQKREMLPPAPRAAQVSSETATPLPLHVYAVEWFLSIHLVRSCHTHQCWSAWRAIGSASHRFSSNAKQSYITHTCDTFPHFLNHVVNVADAILQLACPLLTQHSIRSWHGARTSRGDRSNACAVAGQFYGAKGDR